MFVSERLYRECFQCQCQFFLKSTELECNLRYMLVRHKQMQCWNIWMGEDITPLGDP